MSAAEHLAESLQAEFVILHRAGGHDATDEYLRDFLGRELKRCESRPKPADLMEAHQFLYYVLSRPVLTDQQYDTFCRRNGLEGNGGSDRAADYRPEIAALAIKILRKEAKPS